MVIITHLDVYARWFDLNCMSVHPFPAREDFCFLLSLVCLLFYVAILQTIWTQIRLLPWERSVQGS